MQADRRSEAQKRHEADLDRLMYLGLTFAWVTPVAVFLIAKMF